MTRAELTIELLEQSRNLTIRTMFLSEEAGREIDDFITKHHLQSRKEYTSGEPSGVVLTGEKADLEDFIKQYLSEDGGRGVYALTPLEKV